MGCCAIIFSIIGVAILCCVDIRCCLTHVFTQLPTLKNNLIYVEGLLSHYSGLLLFLLIMAFLLYIALKFKPYPSEFSFAGITFSLRKPDVKKHVRLFLNTKRSLFVFIEKYDNLYYVMRSWYEILQFLRSEISSLDNISGEDISGSISEDGKKCEEMLLELNVFLTKYHADYRRWYEQKTDSKTDLKTASSAASSAEPETEPKIASRTEPRTELDTEASSRTAPKADTKAGDFIFCYEIQQSYPLYKYMIKDIKEINAVMQERFVPYFGINAEKWKDVARRLED